VAYRWQGEERLNADHFVWIQVDRDEQSVLNKPLDDDD